MSEKKDTEDLVEYNGRRVYPEVAEYFRTYQQRARDYERAVAAADVTFNEAYRELRWQAEDEGRRFNEYEGPDRERIREARRTRDAAYEAAERDRQGGQDARDLLLNSPHPLVAWIAREALFNHKGGEVEGHARTVLKMLPATPEEVYEKAKNDHGMCEVFDQFYDRADAAGILGEKLPGYRERAALRSYLRRNYGASYVASMMQRVDPIIKAVQEDYERRLAEAKAEWQRLDEARAENTHRNRSEGARRAAETRRRNAEEAADRGADSVSVAEAPAETPEPKAEPTPAPEPWNLTLTNNTFVGQPIIVT